MQQAILIKKLSPTNTKGARYRVSDDLSSLTVPYDHSMRLEDRLIAAAQQFIFKHCPEWPAVASEYVVHHFKPGQYIVTRKP